MPAVQTQLLADETHLAALGPPAASFGMLSSATKLAHLRMASGEVLAAYGKRMKRPAGASFTLATWGDLTIGYVVKIASFTLLYARGFRDDSAPDKMIRAEAMTVREHLRALSDLTSAASIEDPDVVDSTPSVDEFGVLGGGTEKSDAYTEG